MNPLIFSTATFAGIPRYAVKLLATIEGQITWVELQRVYHQTLRLQQNGALRTGLRLCDSSRSFDEVCLRWAQLAILTQTVVIADSSIQSSESFSKMKDTFILRETLIPYIFSTLSVEGMTLPLARSLLVESPKEEPLDSTDVFIVQQYMLGPSILVSPILKPNSDPHQIYFPLFRNNNNSTTPLYSFYDGARVSENSQGKTVEINVTSLPPMFIKGGSIMVLRKNASLEITIALDIQG